MRLVVALLFAVYVQNFSPTHSAEDFGKHVSAIRAKVLEIIKTPFVPETSASIIEKALHDDKAFNPDPVVDELTIHTNSEVQQIRQAYFKLFGQELTDVLKAQISGDLQELLVGLCLVPAEYDAIELHKAIEGFGTTEETLTEILVTRTNHQIILIKDFYWQRFNSKLEVDLANDLSGTFESLIDNLARPSRDESNETNVIQAQSDAETLYNAGEGDFFGTDEEAFVNILSVVNKKQMQLLRTEYLKVAGRTLESSIDSEFSWLTETHEKQAFLDILTSSESMPGYFAQLLSNAFPSDWEKFVEDASVSLNPLSTSSEPAYEALLRRIMISRHDNDLKWIEKAFNSSHKRKLVDAIASVKSGVELNAYLKLLAVPPPYKDREFDFDDSDISKMMI